MSCDPWTKVIIARDDLQDARWKDRVEKLDDLKIAKRRERRWLDDHSVTSDKRRSDLPGHQQNLSRQIILLNSAASLFAWALTGKFQGTIPAQTPRGTRRTMSL